MNKWITLLMAGILMSFVIVGCGGGEEGDTAADAPATSTGTDTTTEDAATAAPTDEGAAAPTDEGAAAPTEGAGN